MADLATLVVNLRGDISDLRASMSKAQGVLGGFQKAASKLGGVLAGAFATAQIGQYAGEAARLAGELEGVSAAFRRVGGVDYLDDLRAATKGTVSDLELMKRAVQASNFDIPLNQLANLFKFASKRAQETGESVDFLVNSIVLGIGRKSPLILDNLGISAVRLRQELKGVGSETASVGDIAAAVGKIAETELAKSGDIIETTAIKTQQWAASLLNAKASIGALINEGLNKFAPLLDQITAGFVNAFKTSGQVLNENRERVDSLEKSLNPLVSRYEELNKKSSRSAEEQKELNTIIEKIAKVLPSAVTGWDSYGNAIGISTEKIAEYIKAQKDFLAVQNEKEIEGLTKRLADQKAELNSLVSLLQRGEKTIKSGGGFGALTQNVKLTNEELKQLSDRVAEQTVRIEQTENAIKGYRGELDPAADSASKLGAAIEESKKALGVGEIDKESEAWKRFSAATEAAEANLALINAQKDIQKSLSFELPEPEAFKGVIDNFTKIDEVGRKVSETLQQIAIPQEWISEDNAALSESLELRDQLIEKNQAIADTAASVYSFIGAGVEGLAKSFLNGKNGLKEFGQALASFVKEAIAKLVALAAVAAVVSALLPGAGGFGKVFGLLRGGGGGGGLDILKLLRGIPKFADGGIITRPTLGVVGEAGPEAVLPLSRLGKYTQAAPQTLTARVEGQDLLFILEDAQRRRGNTL